ncbi:collagen alpha-3(VI) chain-like [Salarias fasciatus]|uniref:collagen alpha-3(VI) chain-like n=1 Tax=Salarias fasciatus TaxID=181472 RepID=UPI001176B7D4|nr:collagen alpha-3(VI) chain-like [Salarias fasciatus]
MKRPPILLLCALIGVLLVELSPELYAQEVIAGGKRDIVFLVDSTIGSVSMVSLRDFIKRFVEPWVIGPNAVQVGVALFNSSPSLLMDLNTHETKEQLIAALGEMKPTPGQTVNIGAALDFVRLNMLIAEKGSRFQQGVPQLLLLVTSKNSSDAVEQPASALKHMGVLTLVAGSRAADEQQLKQIALADQLVFMTPNFRGLFRNPREIVDALSTLTGVTATEAPTESVEAISPKNKTMPPRDVVFLLDGSDHIGSSNFPSVRDFIINVVSQLEVQPEGVQIGLVQFASHPKVEFYLNSYDNKQDIVNRTSELSLSGGSVLNIGAALDYTLVHMFQQSSGSRRSQGVQQMLILITGGPSHDRVKSVADKMALAGVLVLTVSSGQADENQLRTVAFVPRLAFHKTHFNELPAVAQLVIPFLRNF